MHLPPDTLLRLAEAPDVGAELAAVLNEAPPADVTRHLQQGGAWVSGEHYAVRHVERVGGALHAACSVDYTEEPDAGCGAPRSTPRLSLFHLTVEPDGRVAFRF